MKMTSTSRKIHSRRRLAALTFLSNISLDGTHRDTNLCHLNFNLQSNKIKNKHTIPLHHKENWIANRSSGSIDTVLQRTKNAENVAAIRSLDYEGRKLWQRRSEDKTESGYYFEENLPSKSRDRVHKFMNEAKARLCNLSQKRKQQSHQKSYESYVLPSVKSTESLGGCRSRKASLCPSECSALITEIKFIQNIKDHRNEAERIVLVSQKKSPIVLFSVVPYSRSNLFKGDSKLEGSRRRHTSSRQLSIIADGPDPFDLLALLGVEKPKEGQDVSYGKLLTPSNFSKKGQNFDSWVDSEGSLWFPYQILTADPMACIPFILSSTPPKNEKCAERDDGLGQSYQCLPSHCIYHPNLLDDPELNAGKHSTLLVFPSYITSVIDYVKPSDLKKDLNDKFKERFPHIQLTLSKLRSLKKEMYKIAKVECNIDLSIIAQAFVYFEKLVLKVLVNKQNRKLCAGACLLLSAKLNDVNRTDLQTLVEKIETVFRINRKDLMCLEFGILVALEFSLLLNTAEILPHYQRLVYES